MTSGSIDSAQPETVRQPLRDAVATSGASARSEAATTAIFRGTWLIDLQPWEVGRTAAPEVERRGQPGIGCHGAIAEGAHHGIDVGPGRHRQRSDQAPAGGDPPDQGGSDGGRARIEGEECSGLARHLCMLPGPAAGWVRPDRAVRRPRRSPRRSPRDGR